MFERLRSAVLQADADTGLSSASLPLHTVFALGWLHCPAQTQSSWMVFRVVENHQISLVACAIVDGDGFDWAPHILDTDLPLARLSASESVWQQIADGGQSALLQVIASMRDTDESGLLVVGDLPVFVRRLPYLIDAVIGIVENAKSI